MSGDPDSRWYLWRPSTTPSGVTVCTIARRGDDQNDEDFEELVEFLRSRLGAVDGGELQGPNSLHWYRRFARGQLNVGATSILGEQDR